MSFDLHDFYCVNAKETCYSNAKIRTKIGPLHFELDKKYIAVSANRKHANSFTKFDLRIAAVNII